VSVRLLVLRDVDGRYLGRRPAIVLDIPGLYALRYRDCPCWRCAEGLADPVTCPQGEWRWWIACAAGIDVIFDVASLPIARAAARELATVPVPWTATDIPALRAAAGDIARRLQAVKQRARAAEHRLVVGRVDAHPGACR
jgi:hypothetical protein